MADPTDTTSPATPAADPTLAQAPASLDDLFAVVKSTNDAGKSARDAATAAALDAATKKAAADSATKAHDDALDAFEKALEATR